MKNGKKGTGGFTLVELIVVIAILAILAGVGTVAYSGYVKKANEVADQQLLGAINTAFAAACIENGTDVQSITSASMGLNADKTVNLNAVDPYADSFAKYYVGNESAAFRVTNSLVFDAEKHAFVDPATAGDITLSYGGGVVRISSEDIAALAGSTFITAEGLGVAGLLNKVNDVATFAGYIAESDMMSTVYQSPAFQAYAAAAMGISMEGKTQEELMAEFAAKQSELVAQMMAADSTLTVETATNKLLANAAILYAANNATQMNQSDIVDLLSVDGAKTAIIADLNSDPGKALSEAALAYGMYTAYAYSTGDEGLIASTSDPISILNGLDDEGFQNYMKQNQGATDLDGYLAALNMVNNSTGDTDAVTSVLINGFNDPALIELLQQAVNNG